MVHPSICHFSEVSYPFDIPLPQSDLYLCYGLVVARGQMEFKELLVRLFGGRGIDISVTNPNEKFTRRNAGLTTPHVYV